jgi:hypothetical protein
MVEEHTILFYRHHGPYFIGAFSKKISNGSDILLLIWIYGLNRAVLLVLQLGIFHTSLVVHAIR